MPRRISTSFVLATCLAVVFATPSPYSAVRAASLSRSASAQESSSFTVEGKITQTESGKFTLNTQDNILFHVRYSDKTEIKRADGREGSAKDLSLGARVHVEGDLEESGEIAAAKIALQSDSSRKP
jgi:Domain of unknown function (DUF5666)